MNVTYEPAHKLNLDCSLYDYVARISQFVACVDGVDIYQDPEGRYYLTPNELDETDSEFSYVSSFILDYDHTFNGYPDGPLEFLQMLHKLNK